LFVYLFIYSSVGLLAKSCR